MKGLVINGRKVKMMIVILEFRIEVDALTKDVSLIITDFAEDEESVEESKRLWENQIDELKHTIGA